MLMEAPSGVNEAAARLRRRNRIVLVVFGALLFLWRTGAHDLWPPDEPRFGLVAKEMRASGDPIVLSLNGALYTDKPPLFFWAINLFAWLRGGVDEWAARLPSALFGIGSLLLVEALGSALFDPVTGLVGALVFATSLQVAERARWASIDMTLTFCVLAAIICLWRARAAPAPTAARAAWVLMGLATLAKGPVGLLLPLLAVLPAVLLERDWRSLRRLCSPSGILLYLAVTLAWFIPWASRLGTGAALGVTWHQTAERYVDAWNGRHPVWYYLWQFPANFLPWVLFLPGAARRLLSDEGRSQRRATLFLTTWFAAIFIFFSFSTGKRGVYLLPLYPAASLLVARFFTSATWRHLRAPMMIWVALAAVLGIALPMVAARRDPDLRSAAVAIGALILSGALGAAAIARRGRPERAALTLAAPTLAALTLAGSMAAALLVMIAVIQPSIDRHENLRPFARRIGESLAPGEIFGSTEQKREAWVFYTGRRAEPADSDAAVLAFLAGPGSRALVIEENKLAPLRDRLPAGVVEALRDRVAGQDYFLLRKPG